MSCSNPVCRLNDDLLAILPELSVEEQQQVLIVWRNLALEERTTMVRDLRARTEDQTDLQTLSRLASYFQCGVYDVMRYTSQDVPPAVSRRKPSLR